MLPPSRKRRSQNSSIVDNITSAQKQLQFQKFKRIKKSEFRPETTTKEQCKKDRSQEELANKFLMLCLASYGGSSVSYSVLKFISIGSSDQSLQLQEIQFPSSGDGDCFGMGFGVVGSNLYVLGGQRREKKGKHAAFLPRYSLYDCNPKVFMLDLANSKTKVASQVGEMLSGMASPLIIVVEGKLYVLAGIPVSMLPKHPFEAHLELEESELSTFSSLFIIYNSVMNSKRTPVRRIESRGDEEEVEEAAVRRGETTATTAKRRRRGSCQWVQTLMLDICKIRDAIVEKKLQCSYQNQRKIQGGCISSVQKQCAISLGGDRLRLRMHHTLAGDQLRLRMHQISKRKVKLVI